MKFTTHQLICTKSNVYIKYMHRIFIISSPVFYGVQCNYIQISHHIQKAKTPMHSLSIPLQPEGGVAAGFGGSLLTVDLHV